jgi:uncharacterized protein YndB with AHSA1/START domain
MARGLIAEVATTIDAPREKVWDALVNPLVIKQYMFGTEVESAWEVGSPIVWKGEWQGKPYEDKGVILQLETARRIQYSHFSPLSGHPDVPENYHTVTVELSDDGALTLVELSQDNNSSEEAREQSRTNWKQMLGALKHHLEDAEDAG